QQVTGGGTITMPPSGSYAVTDSIPISSTTSPATFDQIWVHNIAFGQSDVYSAKANFSVACGLNPIYTHAQNTTTLIKPVLTLNSLEWTWRSYTYQFVGFMSTYVPEFGTGPCTDLCIGWIHVKNGDSAWLYHHNSYTRGWIAFANTLKTAKATKATLTLPIDGGDSGCLGGIGMATGPWHGVAQHDFPSAHDADFSLPTSFTVNGSSVTFDVTSIVQAWESGHSNDGFAIKSRLEDNGSDGNDSCSFSLGTNGVLTIQQ
ncbi:MAG: hypothetical protein JO293_08520, partial [Candidatus Eremiobacteraeota bacterium]|nr:hypothetical protein [Candidatus Eremiobacteraeota bacterium]